MYKRQLLEKFGCSFEVDEVGLPITNLKLRLPCGYSSVSYTHLDVYKRQGINGVHITWVYTGNERFEYNGNYQWNELIGIGKTFSYNTGQGYRTAYDTNEVELSENGWYTVFAIWYEEGEKLHVVKNFHAVSYTHLDVYKRQLPRRRQRMPQICRRTLGCNRTSGVRNST